ncbi:MAG TPA: PBP1A family penicillin-binding protein, partial [Actinomycetota bacterium]|nr:PBP1A family penicillin-binding protein [Actinomycetota bacterium]
MTSHARIPRVLELLVALTAGAALVATSLLPAAGGAARVVDRLQRRIDRLDRDIDLGFPRLPERSTILAADGTRLATLFLEENRKVVRLWRVPEITRRAVLAIEDADFYEHRGVDPASVARAVVTNVLAGEVEQGASTITQQLARRVIPEVGTRETVARKLREARVAIRLEREYTKNQLLELYLNEVYFGGGAYGIGTAARRYFGKSVNQLTLPESAMLAGLIAAPNRFTPLQHPEAASDRRNLVLRRMKELGWIEPRRAERAAGKPIELTERTPLAQRRPKAPFFVEYIKRQILADERFGHSRQTRQRVLYQGGLRIHTTLRPPLQRAAGRAVRGHLPRPRDPEAALVAVRPGTGAIRALVGGQDFDRQKFDAATQGRRQAGSAFKPFTLAAALRQGISPGRTYDGSSPKVLRLPNGRTWEVDNAGGADFGRIDLREATRSSVNVVYAQLILDVGPRAVVRTARRMGIRSELPAVPSLALGTAAVSPLEMASAYATIASGVSCRPFAVRKVVDRDGEVLMRRGREDRCERALAPRVAVRLIAMLRPVVESGTGTAADLGRRPVFGKTGTTDDFADAWFVGCSRQLCASSWVGHLEGRVPMTNVHGITVYGGTFPARIWRDFMAAAMEGLPIRGFPEPPPLGEPERAEANPSARPESPEPPPEPSPEDSPEPTAPPEVPEAPEVTPEPSPEPVLPDPRPEPSPSPSPEPSDEPSDKPRPGPSPGPSPS